MQGIAVKPVYTAQDMEGLEHVSQEVGTVSWATGHSVWSLLLQSTHCCRAQLVIFYQLYALLSSRNLVGTDPKKQQLQGLQRSWLGMHCHCCWAFLVQG
jgi:hypothetical protein